MSKPTGMIVTNERSIAGRINKLREAALAIIPQLTKDREGPEKNAIRIALDFMEELKDWPFPLNAAGSIRVDHQRRPDHSSPLEQAKDIAEEIRAIEKAFVTSGIEDQEFARYLEQLACFVSEL